LLGGQVGHQIADGIEASLPKENQPENDTGAQRQHYGDH
jgi:hypothetical protein